MRFALSALDDARVGVYSITFDVYSEALEAFKHALAIKLALVDSRPY